MEHLKETERFKIYEEGDDLVDFLRKLVIWLENLHSDKVKRINWLLNRVAGDKIELVKPGNLIGDDGNVRIIVDAAGDVKIQLKVSGTWTDTGWKVKMS